MRYRIIALILIMAVWLGCGEDEKGTLELKINNPPDSPITQARLRVDGKYEDPSFNLSATPPVVYLDAGRHVVAVHLLDEKGNQLHSYGPMIIEIKAGEVTSIGIPIVSAKGTSDEILIEKWILKSVRLERTKNLDPPVPLDPNGNCLRIANGETIAKAWVVEVKDKNGNPIKEFIVSNESTLDSGRVCLNPLESNEAKRVYTGDADGQFTMYRGGRDDKEVIFEGTYITRPPGNLRMAIDPTKDPSKEDPLIEFTQQMFVEAFGKGDYENHILRGTAKLELKGDLLMNQELELYRKR
jgi:hypothetical protein